jgi:hypothetical protein
MARTRTLALLRAEVQARADIENDPHITSAEVDRFINQSMAALHQKAALACEDEYTTSVTLTTTAGTEVYSISEKFFKLVSVDALVNGQLRPMRRWNFAERHAYLNDASWGSISQPLAYRTMGGDLIHFLPKPDGVYSVTVWYIATSVILTADADLYDGRDGFEEWVVLDAAIKCKTKSEEDIRELAGERDRVMLDIMASLATKDQGRPDRVVDVVGRGGWGWEY